MSLAAAMLPLGIGAVAAHVLAAHHPTSIANDFHQPLVVATNWGAYGALAVAILAASVALTTALLVLAVRGLHADPRTSDLGAILVAALVGIGFTLAWPFVFSSDLYAYTAYGDLAARGLDPYRLAPATLHDAFLDAARFQWSGPFPVDVYGPGMLAIARAVVGLTGNADVALALASLRALTIAAFLGSVVALHAALASCTPRRRFVTTATFALHPVILWSVTEGHNDAFVALAASLAALAIARGRVVVGAFAIGLLPVFKATGALFAVGLALAALARPSEDRSQRALWALAVGCVGAAALAIPPLLPALAHIGAHGRYAPSLSLQGLIGPLPALAIAAAATIVGAVRVVRSDGRGFAWIGIAALCALPNAYPWYALWLLPWALAASGSWPAIALGTATICNLARYLPDAAGIPDVGTAHLLAGISIAPLALALIPSRVARAPEFS
jgi:hypothetical protein